MAVCDIYSKRGKQLPDVYQFESLPAPLRVQIRHIIRTMFKGWPGLARHHPHDLYSILHETLAHEYGLLVLANGINDKNRVETFLLEATDIERVLDVIEVALRLVDQKQPNFPDPSEAINELKGHYHWVSTGLYFCQMPEMDGYQATVEIRKRAGGDCHTPIVVLAANAMEGDRERCLQTGMDDYLSKPIERKTLLTTLQRWLRDDSDESESETG